MTHAILLTLFILATASVLLAIGLVLVPRLVRDDRSEAHLRFEQVEDEQLLLKQQVGEVSALLFKELHPDNLAQRLDGVTEMLRTISDKASEDIDRD